MPEGDTIHKIARFLAPELEQQQVKKTKLLKRENSLIRNKTVESVYAQGKHLFIRFDNGYEVRSHLGMYGSWHSYGIAEPWQKPKKQASLELETKNTCYVCFNAKEVELLKIPSVRQRIVATRLGPDLIGENVNFGEIIRRARTLVDEQTPIADLLLDQRVACGIGNVYKSEILFLERCPPKRPIGQISDATLLGFYQRASKLLKNNLGGGKRVTRNANDDAGRLWVYDRVGKPCHECKLPIQSARQGQHHRSTYWCARCQDVRD